MTRSKVTDICIDFKDEYAIIIKYLDELEDRVRDLEDKMDLIESRSNLLQSVEERYYN